MNIKLCENMRCAVRGCKSNSSDVTTQHNFHRFPLDPDLRKQWMMNTGIDVVTKDLTICSLHFEPSCFHSDCNRELLTKYAVPTIFLVSSRICRACLATDCKMFPLTEERLKWYENLTGLDLKQHSDLPKWLCSECHQRLINVNKFRNKCLSAHKLLLDVLDIHDVLDLHTIKTVDRGANNLVSSLQIQTDLVELKFLNQNSDEFSYEVNLTEHNDFVDVIIKEEVTKYDDDEPMKVDDEKEIGDDDGENKGENKGYDVVKENDGKSGENNEEKNVGNDKHLKTPMKSDILQKKRRESATESDSDNEVLSHVKKIENIISKKKNITPDKEVDGFTITSLSFEEQVEELEKRKESDRYKKTQYHCDICHVALTGQLYLDKHMPKHTDEFGKYVCPVCKVHFRNKKGAKSHVANQHLYRYSCSHCNYATSSRPFAKLHNSSHKGEEYKCPHCPQIFTHSTTLTHHVKKKHPSPDDPEYFCDLCGLRCLKKISIFHHKQKKHSNYYKEVPEDGPFCEICDVRFLNEEAYNNHMKCSLKHETKSEGTEPQPPKKKKKCRRMYFFKTCVKCNKKCRDNYTYNRHVQTRHPEDYAPEMYPRVPKHNATDDAAKKPHEKVICDQCGKWFSCQTTLKEHSWVHTGVKQHACDECGKHFPFKQFLKQHKLMHKGQHFVCDVCDKRFTFSSNLTRHKLIHTGLRPFKCESCEKTFKNKGELTNHTKHVHLNIPWPTRKRPREKTRERRPPVKELI